jgi:hypothetical protein
MSERDGNVKNVGCVEPFFGEDTLADVVARITRRSHGLAGRTAGVSALKRLTHPTILRLRQIVDRFGFRGDFLGIGGRLAADL